MAWRDELQTGSFRDAPFLIRSASTPVGRRNAVHEYPLRDIPYVEDMGRRRREFSIVCFVIGEDYMSQRDALADALEQEGAGTLIHPYRGSLNVQVLEATIDEDSASGGQATFQITFLEAGENRFPQATANTRGLVESSADSALGVIQDGFATVFSTAGVQEFVRDAASSDMTSLLNDIKAARDFVPDVTDQVGQWTKDFNTVLDSVATLVLSPQTLANDVVGLISGLVDIMTKPVDAVTVLRHLFNAGADLIGVASTTPSRAQQAANQAASIELVRAGATIEAARAASRMEFESLDQAVAVRETITEQMDALMETADDETFTALTDLRALMVDDIHIRGADLARLAEFVPDVTMPAAVIAYQLYGDASREDEIVVRNRIRHPDFVPGGQPLEVLTRVV